MNRDCNPRKKRKRRRGEESRAEQSRAEGAIRDGGGRGAIPWHDFSFSPSAHLCLPTLLHSLPFYIDLLLLLRNTPPPISSSSFPTVSLEECCCALSYTVTECSMLAVCCNYLCSTTASYNTRIMSRNGSILPKSHWIIPSPLVVFIEFVNRHRRTETIELWERVNGRSYLSTCKTTTRLAACLPVIWLMLHPP